MGFTGEQRQLERKAQKEIYRCSRLCNPPVVGFFIGKERKRPFPSRYKKTITFVVYKKEIQMLPDELKGMIAVLAVRDRWTQDIIFQKETAKAGGRQTGQNQDRNH